LAINTGLKEHGAMTDTSQTPTKQWTRRQATILVVVCLMAGIAGGWSIRGLRNPAVIESAKAATSTSSAPMTETNTTPAPAPGKLKEMADSQAAPLLDKLKSAPNDPVLLAGIGNLYYDAQQYPIAVDYYERALNARPSDAAVRTDMATAYWYMGNPDAAIAEFNKALIYAPNNPNTLFNRGLVKWKGKRDSAGAMADWEKLLATHPNYEQEDQVEQMMTEAKNPDAVKPKEAK
jgi:tetratricopeptide (TPR) repeat protein